MRASFATAAPIAPPRSTRPTTTGADGGAIWHGLPDDRRGALDRAYVAHHFHDALAKAGEVYPLVAARHCSRALMTRSRSPNIMALPVGKVFGRVLGHRAGVHYAVRDYGDYPRVMERVLIASADISA